MFSCILRKPELWYQPKYILERLMRRANPEQRLRDHRLPWGLTLRIDLDDTIGRQVDAFGVFELSVCEAIRRLVDEGEATMDVGANIGHMTGLLAHCVGSKGTVDAFEPNPRVLDLLRSHCDLWRQNPSLGSIRIHPIALSRSKGTVNFYDSVKDPNNCGLGSLREAPGWVRTAEIPTERWDEIMDPKRPIGLAKMDVEGSELLVLEGASEVLKAKGVRDLLFEDYDPYPSKTTQLLEGFGYTVFALGTQLMGPSLSLARNGPAPLRPWDSPNYLATIDPERALKRLKPRGWRVLSRASGPPSSETRREWTAVSRLPGSVRRA
jgi:FkbM family methyltransferase